jgi:peptidyl-prolyl cis-trans isomerase SurA
MLKKGIVLFVGILAAVNFLYGQNTVLDRVVAVVGDRIILESDLEKQAIQYRQQGVFSGGKLKCEILEVQLYQKLLLNQAELDSIEVSPNEVDAQMDQRIQYFISQLGSEEKLEEFYGKSILEIEEEFRPVISDQIMSQRMQSELTKDVDVTPTDVRKFYERLPKDSLPLINEKLQIQQLVRYPEISHLDILAVTQRLQKFKERIEGGERFETLAALYSQDEASAARGGTLGYVGRSDLVTEFAAVAFKLNVGQVSRVVKTEYGYHIIKLIDRRGAKINCQHILLKPKVKPAEKVQAYQFLDSVRNQILTDTLTWEQAVDLYSDDEETRNNQGLLINYQNGSSEFEKRQIQPAISQAIKKLNEGDISQPFEATDDNTKVVFKIVRVKRKKPAHTANLSDDYKAIQEMALQEKSSEHVEEWVDKKRESTYIRIIDEYKSCKFKYKWLK